jgi:hypothetical protein
MSTGYSAAVPDDTALIDLLGALAYGELTAFDRLAEDARMAPTLSGRAALCEMAAVEIGHYRLLANRIIDLGAIPEEAMAPFVPALDGFHEMTSPSTWLEGLVKAYVGDGLAADFYREIAEFRRFVYPRADSRGVGGLWQFSVCGPRGAGGDRQRAGPRGPAVVVGSSACWGGHQSDSARAGRARCPHRVARRRTGDLLGVAALISRITDRHADRMRELGLSG